MEMITFGWFATGGGVNYFFPSGIFAGIVMSITLLLLIFFLYTPLPGGEKKPDESRYFRMIFENAFQAVGLMNVSGEIIAKNERMKEILEQLGATGGEKKIWEIPVISSDLPLAKKFRDAIDAAQNGKQARFQAQLEVNRSSPAYYDFSIKPIQEKSGKVNNLLVEGREITKLIDIQKQLEYSERQLRTFVAQSPMAVAMLDNEMRYIAVSNEWVNVYDIDQNADELVGADHFEILPETKKREDWMEVVDQCLNGDVKQRSSNQDKMVKEDGSVIWIKWVAAPWYDRNGEVGGVMFYTEDITEIIESREQLAKMNRELEEKVKERTRELEVANEKLNHANKELETFSYSVSHDLRAPLRAVVGFSNILEEEYGDTLDDEAKRLLGVITDNASRMGDLIDDILKFSRVGRSSLSKEKVDMNKLAKNTYGELKKFEEGSAEISFEIKNKLPTIEADRSLMRQVLQNLLSNAIKYSSKNERPVIEVGSREEEKEDAVTFYVKDNGAGFDMKYYDKLFGLFQRLHRDSEFEGNGIGLALVKRILTKHNGEIWAESEPGEGTTFYFRLPKNNKS